MRKSPLLFLVSSLALIGIIFIALSSLSEANNIVGDKFFFLKKQLIWLTLGFISLSILSKIKTDIIKRYAYFFYMVSTIILLAILIPTLGNQIFGARRWLNLGNLGFQPSEIFKFVAIIFFPFLFSQIEKRNLKTLIIYLGLPFFLIILEPNLSTALLISAIVISIYYLSGGEIKSLSLLCLIFTLLGFILIIISPYRTARLKSLIHPTQNQNTSSYQSNQIILSISSGGWFGKGFANSDQQYRFLPKISTDSILAIIAEETGFFGVFIILILYIYLITYLLKLSQKIPDQFSSLLTAGVACWIAYQSLINIAAIVAIIPLTGVPLPFISYGGSSLFTLMSAIGLIRQIEKRPSLLLYSKSDNKALKKDHYHRHPPHSRHRTYSSTSSR